MNTRTKTRRMRQEAENQIYNMLNDGDDSDIGELDECEASCAFEDRAVIKVRCGASVEEKNNNRLDETVESILDEQENGEVYFERQNLIDKNDVEWIKGTYISGDNYFFKSNYLYLIDTLPSPVDLFSSYISDTLLETVAQETNLYAVKNNIARFPPTNVEELRTFFGIHIIMGNLSYPRINMYWEREFAIPLISKHMMLRRFYKLRNVIHFVTEKPANSTRDIFWKVRPLYDAIRNRCKLLEKEEIYSIDEQMVPFKGQLSVKQYIRNKPTKWGVKLFLLCGVSGIAYDFIIYQGSTTEFNAEYSKFGQGPRVVMQLSERIPRMAKLYFDNYFSSFYLFQWLQKQDIFASGTIRTNRFVHPPFTNDKEIKKKYGKGYMENVICKSSGVVLTKWFDNSSVNLASNFEGIGENPDTCERWDKKN